MSFSVALQSAIFYVCSCTPCLQAEEHRRSKKQAKKDRVEKRRLEEEMPHLYRHPDPFNTNPYWGEEIQMGPSLPSKKNSSGSKNISQRRLTSAGRDSRSVAGSSIGVGSTHHDSSPTVLPEDRSVSLSTSLSDDWNKKRYERQDEELWGREFSWTGYKLMDAIKEASSAAGRIIDATLGKEPKTVSEDDRYKFYSSARVPPVNEYHPPVVSQRPKHKDAAKWMLQPPPPAKVMEGKVPVSRSMSMASAASRKTAASESPALGRLVHEKMVADKLRKGEMPPEVKLAAASNRPTTTRRNTSLSQGGQSQRSTRSRSLSLESSDASDELKKQRRRRRPKPLVTPEMDSSDDEDCYARANTDSLGIMTTRAAQRPKLQTILSSQASSISDGQDKLTVKTADKLQPSPLRDISNTTSEPRSKAGQFLEPIGIEDQPIAKPAPVAMSA